jgi:hypothetical protein
MELSVSAGGASNSFRACTSPSAGVHIFLISPARFQVRDVRQPFLFEWNIGELLELRPRVRLCFLSGTKSIGSFFL